MQARIKELEKQVAQPAKELETLHQSASMGGAMLRLLETLDIQQAVMHQAVTHGTVQAPSVVEAAPVRAKALPSIDLIPAEKQQLTLLRPRLKKLSGFQRRVLCVLATQEGMVMNVTQIAAWPYVQEKTVQSQPPRALMRMGLIERSKGVRGTYRYTSRLRQYLCQHFPRLDTEQLAQQLLAELAEHQ